MFCRPCAPNIFADLFGLDNDKKPRRRPQAPPIKLRRIRPFMQRSESELQRIVNEWMAHVHPRAHEYFQGPGVLEEVLATIATHIDKNDDPLQENTRRCVPWRGDILHNNTYILAQDAHDNAGTENLVASTMSGQELPTGSGGDSRIWPQAVMRTSNSEEDEESVKYINRILTFIFASEESFDSLMRLPQQEPFTMSCGNQLCVHILHVSIDP